MAFSGNKVEVDGGYFYIFPQNKEFADVMQEMLDYAAARKQTGTLNFYFDRVTYTLRSADGVCLPESIMECWDKNLIASVMEVEMKFLSFNGSKLVYAPEGERSAQDIIRMMVTIAQWHDIDVVACFDEKLCVTPEDEFEKVLADYNLLVLSRLEGCADMPEVRAYLARIREKELEDEREYIRLMSELPDFDDIYKTIVWLEDMGRCLNEDLPGCEIIEIFRKFGHEPNQNSEEGFIKENEVISGRWIIGQVLEFIENSGVVCRKIYAFSASWKEMFGYEQVSD